VSAYQIRKARPQDLAKVYAVFSLADDLHRRAHPEIFQEVADPAGMMEYLLSCIKAREAAVFLAEEDDEIIGAILAWVHQSAEVSVLVKRAYVSVDNLIVVEKYRRHGVGRALMDQIYLWAQAHGVTDIQLTVWDFNREALAFYEKLGYQMLHQRMRKELP